MPSSTLVVPAMCFVLYTCDVAKLKSPSLHLFRGTSVAVFTSPWSQVLSVSSSGGTDPSCELEWQAGTSMATPVVAGSAAMVCPGIVLRNLAEVDMCPQRYTHRSAWQFHRVHRVGDKHALWRRDCSMHGSRALRFQPCCTRDSPVAVAIAVGN